MNKKPLNFFERLYLTEIVRGLALTARHFFVNFPRHVARGIGMKIGKGETVTIEYPEEAASSPGGCGHAIV